MKRTITTCGKMALTFSIAALAFTSCKKEAKPENASVLFKHSSPDMTNVDILVDGKKANTTAMTYNNNTGYMSVKTGSRAIKVVNASTGATLVNSTMSLEKDKKYSFIVANRSASPEGILLQDLQPTAVSGKAHLRLVNLSPDAPAYNVNISGSNTNTFSSAAFKSASNFVTLDATAAGTAIAFQVKHPTTNAVVTTMNTTLVAGKVYTIVIRGFVTPPSGNTNALGWTLITNR